MAREVYDIRCDAKVRINLATIAWANIRLKLT